MGSNPRNIGERPVLSLAFVGQFYGPMLDSKKLGVRDVKTWYESLQWVFGQKGKQGVVFVLALRRFLSDQSSQCSNHHTIDMPGFVQLFLIPCHFQVDYEFYGLVEYQKQWSMKEVPYSNSLSLSIIFGLWYFGFASG